jgi:hypothetical protein
MTDARLLGVDAPLRLSGDLSGAAEIEIAGTEGALRAKAAIVAKIHLHLRPCDAGVLGLKDGLSVRVCIRSRRPLAFEDVPVRVREDFMPALHIDFDEANACMFKAGDRCEILPPEPSSRTENGVRTAGCTADGVQALRSQTARFPARPVSLSTLITEADAKRLVKPGGKVRLPKGSILTPSAKDIFAEAYCKIEKEI